MILPAIDGMRTLAEARQQIIECHIESNLPEVAADRHRVGQVVSNLLSNAIKFTRLGGRIVISAQKRENTIVVSVTDEGPGIPREHTYSIASGRQKRRNAWEAAWDYRLPKESSKLTVEESGSIANTAEAVRSLSRCLWPDQIRRAQSVLERFSI